MPRLYCILFAFVLFIISVAAPVSGGEDFPEYPLIREYYLLDYHYPEKDESLHQLRELIKLAPPEAHDAWKTILDGMAAAARGEYDESLAVFDKVLAGSAASDGLTRAFVLAQKGQMIYHRGWYAEAIRVFDRFLATYGDRPESPYCELKAAVLRYKYQALLNGRYDELLNNGDLNLPQDPLVALVEEMRDRPEAGVQLQITSVMLGMIRDAERSSDSHHRDAAIQMCDYLIDRLKDRPEPELRLQVAHAMFSKGFNMSKRGMSKDALETYAGLREYLADRDDLVAVELFATSCRMEGAIWNASGQPDKAIAVYDVGLKRLAGRKEDRFWPLSLALKVEGDIIKRKLRAAPAK